jgi:dTDP-4-amino-4,6-dideoxygalactose transaminase
MSKISLSKCHVSPEVEEAALRAIKSGQYILGKECQAFEAELAAHTGTKHCVLGSSWTMIVYLLHQLQGVGPGDEIIVPSHTAFPTMEPLIHLGARPVFVDVDETYGMDLDQVEAAISPRTVGIIPVYLYGHPVDLDRLLPVAARHHLWVIEDCAQAQGAKYKGRTAGSIADFGAFSFFPSKNLTVLGDGGCITTNNGHMAERLRMLRNHGRQGKYDHEFPGYNVRFNEINAAIGRVMLKHLDRFNENRRKIAAHYNARLKGIVETPPEKEWARAVYHMYVIRSERRDALQQFLKQRDIETGIHYPKPNHLQPAVTGLFPFVPRLPRTEQIVKEILSLPIHGEMSIESADRVCDAIVEFVQSAGSK